MTSHILQISIFCVDTSINLVKRSVLVVILAKTLHILAAAGIVGGATYDKLITPAAISVTYLAVVVPVNVDHLIPYVVFVVSTTNILPSPLVGSRPLTLEEPLYSITNKSPNVVNGTDGCVDDIWVVIVACELDPILVYAVWFDAVFVAAIVVHAIEHVGLLSTYKYIPFVLPNANLVTVPLPVPTNMSPLVVKSDNRLLTLPDVTVQLSLLAGVNAPAVDKTSLSTPLYASVNAFDPFLYNFHSDALGMRNDDILRLPYDII
jgi:hypothetical protein